MNIDREAQPLYIQNNTTGIAAVQFKSHFKSRWILSLGIQSLGSHRQAARVAVQGVRDCIFSEALKLQVPVIRDNNHSILATWSQLGSNRLTELEENPSSFKFFSQTKGSNGDRQWRLESHAAAASNR